MGPLPGGVGMMVAGAAGWSRDARALGGALLIYIER